MQTFELRLRLLSVVAVVKNLILSCSQLIVFVREAQIRLHVRSFRTVKEIIPLFAWHVRFSISVIALIVAHWLYKSFAVQTHCHICIFLNGRLKARRSRTHSMGDSYIKIKFFTRYLSRSNLNRNYGRQWRQRFKPNTRE